MSAGSFSSRIVVAAAIILILSGVALPELLGAIEPSYHSSTNYLSELGADGMGRAALANYAGFLPVAIASAVLAVSLVYSLRNFRLAGLGVLLLGAGLCSGYFMAFLFPCDAGCPASGSARQALHNLGGLIEYAAGFTGLLLMAIGLWGWRRIVAACGAICVAVGFALMAQPELAAWKGAAQRLADYAMFASLILISASWRQRVR